MKAHFGAEYLCHLRLIALRKMNCFVCLLSTLLYHVVSLCVVAVSKFCEAIAEYMANISSSPDPSVQIEYFSGEVCSAWEIFNVWLSSKEAKVNVSR